MARKRGRSGGWSWGARALALLVLAAIIAAVWLWWDTQHWTPDEASFPDQGIEVASRDGDVNFRTAAALGAHFAYLDASYGASGRDPRFTRNLEAARAAGLQVGAVHLFDPCMPADGQSANFVTTVPRQRSLLPAAIALDKLADDCPQKVSDAAVESELMTFINQVENHVGKPVILKVSAGFQARYHIAGMLDRNLWLTRTRFAPTYGGRPWVLWTANNALSSAIAPEPVRWVVAQP